MTTVDEVCDTCGKPSTFNVQTVWTYFSLNEEGEWKQFKQGSSDVNEFYCDRCYRKEIEMWTDEELIKEFGEA